MGTVWDNNDELDAEQELTATDQRDLDYIESNDEGGEAETVAEEQAESLAELEAESDAALAHRVEQGDDD